MRKQKSTVVLQSCVAQPGVMAHQSLNTVCAVKPSTHSITLGKGQRTGGESGEQTLKSVQIIGLV